MKLTSAIGGLAGACALTLINQIVAKVDKKAPRLDLLGMNAVAKFFKSPQSAPLLVHKIFPISMTGDLISNSLYYSMASGSSKNVNLIKGLLLGLGAGIGAVVIPGKIGLDDSTTNRTQHTKVLTIAWYVLGGLVAASVNNAMEGHSTENLVSKKHMKQMTREEEPVLAGL